MNWRREKTVLITPIGGLFRSGAVVLGLALPRLDALLLHRQRPVHLSTCPFIHSFVRSFIHGIEA